jgi:calcium/calmodulin-dependent protein kinase I
MGGCASKGPSGSRSASVLPDGVTVDAAESERLGVVLPGSFLERYDLVPDTSTGGTPRCPVELGHGSFSRVFQARERATGQLCALKHVDTKRLFAMRGVESTNRTKAEVRRGVSVLQTLRHPSVIALLGYFESKSSMCVCLELGDGGELYDHIVDSGKLSEAEAAGIIRSVVEGVAYMHANSLVHRDLKPENIVQCGGTWKIIDFGFSRVIESKTARMKSFVGTLNYVAPEVVRRETYQSSVDVWSIGVITFVLLVGYLPFDLVPGEACAYDLRFKPRHWGPISMAAKSFVARCLNRQADERPTTSELLEMSFLNMDMHRKRRESQLPLDSPQRLRSSGLSGVKRIVPSPTATALRKQTTHKDVAAAAAAAAGQEMGTGAPPESPGQEMGTGAPPESQEGGGGDGGGT